MKQLSIEEFLKQQEAAGKPYLNNEGIPLPWESPVRQANTLSYSTKLTLLPLDRTQNPRDNPIVSKSQRNNFERGQGTEMCGPRSFLWREHQKTIVQKSGKTGPT